MLWNIFKKTRSWSILLSLAYNQPCHLPVTVTCFLLVHGSKIIAAQPLISLQLWLSEVNTSPLMGQTALKNQILAHYYRYRNTFGIKGIDCIDYIPLCQHKINYYHKLTPRDINYALLHCAFIYFHKLPIHWELNHSDWLLELPAAFFLISDQLVCVIYASENWELWESNISDTHHIKAIMRHWVHIL